MLCAAVTGTIEEKNRDKIWIATQGPINNSPVCETYTVYLMFTKYSTDEVLIPQGYHLIKGEVLENSHPLEMIKIPELDWDKSLAALNEKYPPPHDGDHKESDSNGNDGSDEEEEGTETDSESVCGAFLVFVFAFCKTCVCCRMIQNHHQLKDLVKICHQFIV